MTKLPALLLSVLAIVMFATPKTVAVDKTYKPGEITPDELVKLDTGYKAVEKGAAQMLELIGKLGNTERAAEFRDLAKLNVENAAAYRVGFQDAYLFNETAPPPPIDSPVIVPPIEPPTDPGTTLYDVNPAFMPGGQYSHLGAVDVPGMEVWEATHPGAGWTSAWGGKCWNSANVCVFPTEEFRGRTIVFNNDQAAWGEHGPKWGMREYNATGTIADVAIYRAGDWENGREGHAFYFNAWGDLTFDHVRAVECGGQAIQIVWRPSETLIPVEEWEQAQHTLVLHDVEAIDCGQINFGSAVRASYPVSLYNPGQNIDIDGLRIRCEFPPYNDPNEARPVQSHGGLFIGPGQIDTARTPVAWIRNLDVEVTGSDRSELVLWGIDEAHVIAPRIIDHGGTADVSVVVVGTGAVGTVEITDVQTEILVHLQDGSPHKPAMQTVTVHPGESFVWPQ